MKRPSGANCSAIARGGFIRQAARVLHDPSLAVRYAGRRLGVGGFELRCDLDLFERPHYAYGVQQAAMLARRLGLPAVSVVEFGVAGGAGLLDLERLSTMAAAASQVRVDVYGFDRGLGLPEPRDVRDLPYRWKDGFFSMDVEALQSRLTSADLILGDLSSTVPAFAARVDTAPVGFVAVDVDYYSSTVDALGLFSAPAARLLPRVWCYLDDIVGDDICLHSEYAGELAAVIEFNETHPDRKIAQVRGLGHKRIWPNSWCDQMFALHCFDHDDYCTYAGPRPESQELRL